MTGVAPLPSYGGVFLDDRGDERSLRVSWHHDAGAAGLVVLSLWRGEACVGTFRLEASEVASLVAALQAGLQAELQAGLVPATSRHDRAC